ncbi:aminotransferase class III-fold pyridoxal phosphate-dependent enzyme, partial [Oceanospirillum sp. HFRX-1_2]
MSTNASLQDRKNKVFAVGQGNLAPVYVERAKNAEMWDVEGNRYIDFAAGIAVLNTGHCHPKVIEAVKGQVENLTHTCITVTPYEPAVELAEKLVDIAPISGDKKAIFVTTGAEAVENCVKIARAHTGRPGIIAFNGGFHGRTNMTMALTGKVVPYKAQFGPFPAGVYHAPYPNELHGVSIEDSLKALKMLFTCDIEA